MNRSEYTELYAEWWHKLPSNKEFKLVLENHAEGFNWYWFGWNPRMTNVILDKPEITIKDKKAIKHYSWKPFDEPWTYPFQCFTVKNNSLNYSYGI